MPGAWGSTLRISAGTANFDNFTRDAIAPLTCANDLGPVSAGLIFSESNELEPRRTLR